MHRNLNDFFVEGFIEESLAGVRAEKLLDVGCGAAPYMPIYRRSARSVVLLDYGRRTPELSLHGDALRLPFRDASFDVVVLSEVIEHVREPARALAEVARVLRPGGTFVITCPFIYPIHEAPHDISRFTEFGLEDALKRAGLEPLALARRGNLFAVMHLTSVAVTVGALEALARVPVLGIPFRLARWVTERIAELTFVLHYALVRRTRRLRPARAGDGLRGALGTLALWTPGYCARAAKRAP